MKRCSTSLIIREMQIKPEHWRMLLNCGVGEDSWESPWTARRSNQSILKEISPECSLEWLVLKLKLQSFSHLMRRTNSLEKILMVGKADWWWEVKRMRRWDGWMASQTQWTWVWVNSGSWWWTGCAWGCKVRHDWVTELNWNQNCNELSPHTS